MYVLCLTNLASHFRKTLKIGTETKQSAVGLTIYVEKLINILQANWRLFSTIDVLVCSLGQNDTTAEKFEIMKELWNASLRCTTLDVEQSMEDTQNYCEKMNIAHILYIKESEPGVVRLKSWVKDRYKEQFYFYFFCSHLALVFLMPDYHIYLMAQVP